MKVTVENAGPCKKRLKVEVAPEAVRAEIEEHMKEMMARAVLPGFRPGKAPRALLERRVGNQVAEEARNHLIGHSYEEALEQEKLRPWGEPTLDKVDYQPEKGLLSYEAVLEVQPEFELPSTKDLPLKRTEVQVTEADIDAALQELVQQHADWEPAAAGAALEKGMLAVSDLALLEGTKRLWGQENVGIVLGDEPLGELPTGPTAKLLEGYKAGESRQLVATLPEDFSREDLRGRMATISITVKEARTRRLPAADEAFAKGLGAEGLADLRTKLGEHAKRRKESDAHRQLEEDLITHLIGAAKFDLPQDLLGAQAEDTLRRTTVDLLMRGVPEKDLKANLDKIKANTQSSAERRMRATLILSRIAEKEKVFVTESDVEDRLRQMAMAYGERPEGIRKRLEKEGGIAAVRASIREAKVLDLLLSRSKAAGTR